MSKKIKKYDNRGNLIYIKYRTYSYSGEHKDWETWYKYDGNDNMIYCVNNDRFEFWQEFDEYNRLVYYKDSIGSECFYKYVNNRQIFITKEEFEHLLILPRFELLDLEL